MNNKVKIRKMFCNNFKCANNYRALCTVGKKEIVKGGKCKNFTTTLRES